MSRPDQDAWLSATPLDREALRLEVADPAAGAILVFEGTVRDHSDGMTGIVALEYEAQVSMAAKVIAGIVEEIRNTVPVQRISVRHRIGRVALGDPTIVIAVSAAHRDEAYRASRLIIDRIKHEAPIWKREILPDGSGQWSRGCTVHVAATASAEAASAETASAEMAIVVEQPKT